MTTELIRDPREWQRRCWTARDGGRRLAVVPTMGYLHDGHVSLLREARRIVDLGGPQQAPPGPPLAPVQPHPAGPALAIEPGRGQQAPSGPPLAPVQPHPAGPALAIEPGRGQRAPPGPPFAPVQPRPAGPALAIDLGRGQQAPPASKPLALATIFVNPTQFGPSEDLARYPRDLEGDLAKCSAAGIDWVLAPERPGQMYAEGHETWIDVERVSRGLCGEKRPGHFRGVATIVAKLLNLTRPHVAIFGEKDWQQLQVIRALVRDLDFGVEVAGMPIVRERDGLALSSRNAYLSPDERRRALALSRALFEARERAAAGERDAAELVAGATRALVAAGVRVDYVEVVHPTALERVARAEPGSRMLVAAFVGATRLIDNVALP